MAWKSPRGADFRLRRASVRRRGASLVELALVLPVLLTVMFGIMESGRLMFVYTTLADAARAGTRYAIVHGSYRKGTGVDGPSGPGNTTNVVDTVKTITTAAGLAAGSVTVTDSDEEPMYPDGTNNIGARVVVKVSYPFQSLVLPLVPLSLTIGSTSSGTICY